MNPVLASLALGGSGGGMGPGPDGDKVPVTFRGADGTPVLVSAVLDLLTVNGRNYDYFEASGIIEDGVCVAQLFPGFDYIATIGGSANNAFSVPATGMPVGGWEASELLDS